MNRSSSLKPRLRLVDRYFLALLLVGFAGATAADAKPGFSLANTYEEATDSGRLSEYWMSEKYDGVRALWDGEKLVSRGGTVYAAPPWFIAGLPPQAMDGELWLGRGRFEETVSVVRRKEPHAGWRDIKYMVFDLPQRGRAFRERYAAMQALRQDNANPYWQPVPQRPIASAAVLEQYYDEVVAGGGEGVMLRRIDSAHRAGRSDDLLKIKPAAQAQAVVIGYNPGKGKYTGLVGSLRVRTATNKVFNIGSGLTDAQRENPPPVGATIRYRFHGYTRTGLPRFAVFLGVVDAGPGPEAESNKPYPKSSPNS
ncbi:MAG: DNA ligase [Cellvibrionales bacterium]|nr:DNA ligase [Cellvibrionales bacterium]